MDFFKENILEPLRPSSWEKGNYSYLWIYIIVSIILYIFYTKFSDFIYKAKTFSESRKTKHETDMKLAWEKRLKELEEVRVKQEEEMKLKSREERKEDEEKKEAELRSKRREELLRNQANSALGYKRPDVKERYPGVFKKGG